MAVAHRDTITMRTDDKISVLNFGAIELAEQLLWLFLLHLLFFATDVWHNIVQNVHAADARITCTANGLHRYHKDLFETEMGMKWMQGAYQVGGAAIRVTDNKAFPATIAFLKLNQR